MMHLSFEMRSGASDRVVIDFNAAGYKVLDGYYPEQGDGLVTDKFDLSIAGSSADDLESKVRAVELALDFAREHAAGPDGVWVLFAPDEALTDWQSRISAGVVLHNGKIGKRWKDNKAVVQVVFERRAYWETETAVTLIVDNSGGEAGESATVINHEDSDSGDDFYIEIGADQVTGGLPTPAIIEFKNTTNDARLVENLYVGHFAASAPIEPPAATALILEGAGTSDAACSGGAYLGMTWSDAAESQIASWTVAMGTLQQRNYKFVPRFRDTFVYTDLWLKVKLLLGTDVVAETRWALMEASKNLQVIGSLQLPPYRFGKYVDVGNLTVGLYEKRAGGSGAANLDYLAMMPQDSWRKYGAIAGLAYNETLIDNPVEETLVTLYSTASYKVTNMIDEGLPVMLQPGVKNVLYFLHDCDNGSAPIARTSTVAVKCHPRRRSV